MASAALKSSKVKGAALALRPPVPATVSGPESAPLGTRTVAEVAVATSTAAFAPLK